MTRIKMGDMGDMYRDWGKLKKQKKDINRQKIMKLINDFQIPHKTMNFESHVILTLNDMRIDLWPTTNKYKIGNKYFHGAYKFLMDILNYNN